ncbi:zinc finger BED domain-containing protein 4-like [Diabrotica undecimpunctata]|uniref:zinc finger BED domain-containing protein 4-like n=1 Tax=Diabrotica undecimpunctata TaxID=50387 RepID=UPI003B641FA1
MNSKKKTSIVWDFFTIKDDARAKCNMCSQVLSYKTSITNLRQHVQRKHPSITFQESVQCKSVKDQDSVPIDNDETGDGKKISDTEIPSTSGACLEIPKKRKLFQSQLQVSKKVNLTQKKIIDAKLLNLIVKDIQPFSIVEDEGFREFCDAVGYTLPSRKTLTKTLLPAKYLETLNKTREIMATAESVTITTDMWSSRNSDSFIGVTAHFINDKFELESILLEVCLFEGSHTSVNLANELRRVITEWDLHNKIFIVITDNAANVKKAILEELQLKHLGCLAHTINLIAQDGLKVIESLIEKVKLVVSLFKRSNLAKEKLDWYQKQNGKDPKKLIQAVPTRWNSVYYMLERIVNLKEEVRASIAVLGNENVPCITNTDFEEINQLIKILGPLESATRTMSGEKYVTLSSVIIIANNLRKIYHRLVTNPGTSFAERPTKVVEVIFNSSQMRFKNFENSNSLIVSTFMDPRFKNIGFSDESVAERSKNLVINLLTNLLEKNSKQTTAPIVNQLQDDDSSEDEFSIWGDFDKQASHFKPAGGNSRCKAIMEVQRYIEEPLLNRKNNPLTWWKDNRHNYPNLSVIVRNKFGTVSTSVPCERLFSKTGEILSAKRSRLSDEKVKQIMFIRSNS